MKNIVCLLGSPRKEGNSDILAAHLVDAASKLGASAGTFKLNRLNYRGCQACMGCKTGHDRCVLKDDLTHVLEAVGETDILVLASPIYYSEVSAQLKTFVDRTFSFLTPDFLANGHKSRLAPGKKLVFIQTQGQPDENAYQDVFEKLKLFFAWYGFEDAHVIRACAVQEAGDVREREDLFKKTEEIAEKLMA